MATKDLPTVHVEEKDTPSNSVHVPYRVGAWLPSNQAATDSWLSQLIEEVDGPTKSGLDSAIEEYTVTHLHPVIQEFQELIMSDPKINMFFHQMFAQVPKKPPYNKDPTGKPQVQNYQQMLRLLNHIVTKKAPEFSDNFFVGFPINAILNWSMGTIGGFAGFLNDRVNLQLKKILNEWGSFLKSEDSLYVLTDNPQYGWFSEEAKKAMPCFEIEYICDPCLPHHGFKSWDDFFTRKFCPGVRPIAALNDDYVIVNACESAPYNIQRNVRRRDKFWIKSQRYSLEHMLSNDPLVDEFVGGTIYQAYLNALSYHRWHSPVSGIVKKAFVQDGSYYSQAIAMGFDPVSQCNSQVYITEVATRAAIFIEADNSHIGLMCFLAVGMAEVSTCEITIAEGQRVTKGQEIGMFHYGGSTHCLIFRSSTKVEFDLCGQTPGLQSTNIKVNTMIAAVTDM